MLQKQTVRLDESQMVIFFNFALAILTLNIIIIKYNIAVIVVDLSYKCYEEIIINFHINHVHY